MGELDALTIACMLGTLLAGWATFASSKPVSLATLVMITSMSLASTQAYMGIRRHFSPDVAPEPDVRDAFHAYTAWVQESFLK
tara:strand:- start:99 stop:347 length:249 start_codon:yes stop_codon:yes gene_type:complete